MAVRNLVDGFINLITSIGTAKDPLKSQQYAFTPMSQAQLEAAYRSDWVARKVIDIPAKDATREWRSWQATQQQIEQLEDLENVLQVRSKIYSAALRARLYGGAAIIIGCDVGMPEEPLDLRKVKRGSLRYLHVVNKHELSSGELEDNVEALWHGEPRWYIRNNGVNQVRIHPSRVVRMLGAEIPELSADGWGDSMLQVVDDAIRSLGAVQGGVAAMVHDAKLDIFKVPGLTKNIATKEYESRLIQRFTVANANKSILNAIIMDKEEEHSRISTSFSTLPDLVQMYLLIAAGAADIPVMRFLGQSAPGFSNGDNDVRNYYDRVASDQKIQLSPAIARLDEVLIRAALGSDDPNVYYEWNPLWQLDEIQKADLASKKAAVFKIDADLGLIDEEALRISRENQLIEDGTYPGLEAALEEASLLSLEETGEALVPLPAAAESGSNDAPVLPAPTFDSANVGIAPRVRARARIPRHSPGAGRYARKGDWPFATKPHEVPKGAGMKDAKPRTLYVRRDVLNGREILEHFKSQGFQTTLTASDLHVTIAFSKAPLDWMKIEEDWTSDRDGKLVVPAGGPRVMEVFGEGAHVLLFNSSHLSYRHEHMKRAGASFDFADYSPHVTISYEAPSKALDEVVPWRGAIILGPEIFEEVDENWRDKIVEK